MCVCHRHPLRLTAAAATRVSRPANYNGIVFGKVCTFDEPRFNNGQPGNCSLFSISVVLGAAADVQIPLMPAVVIGDLGN
jgi:hypothetical protein